MVIVGQTSFANAERWVHLGRGVCGHCKSPDSASYIWLERRYKSYVFGFFRSNVKETDWAYFVACDACEHGYSLTAQEAADLRRKRDAETGGRASQLSVYGSELIEAQDAGRALAAGIIAQANVTANRSRGDFMAELKDAAANRQYAEGIGEVEDLAIDGDRPAARQRLAEIVFSRKPAALRREALLVLVRLSEPGEERAMVAKLLGSHLTWTPREPLRDEMVAIADSIWSPDQQSVDSDHIQQE